MAWNLLCPERRICSHVLRFVIAVLACTAAQAHAAGITFDTSPPGSVIVAENGLEWIWAAPCATHDPSCGTPGNPAGTLPIQGFREPTLAEWAGAWADRDELISRFIVGGAAVCGSPWTSSFHDHCDGGDLLAGFVWQAAVNGICDPGGGCDNDSSESFLVRESVLVADTLSVAPHPAPEPGTFLLLGSGLVSLGIATWRRARRT